MNVFKRDGRKVPYDRNKITDAVWKAFKSSGEGTLDDACRVSALVEARLMAVPMAGAVTPSVENIQDLVEEELMRAGFYSAAKEYCLYRESRSRAREANSRLMRDIDSIINVDAEKNNKKRENANIDGNTPMGAMLQIGASCAKAYNSMYLLRPEQAGAHCNGDIHIHDFDFYALTETCCQIDILKLFHGGFSTGHGFLREPQSIQSYAALAAIAIQANQNDQHEQIRAA